jgi:hypothetical protein
MSSTSLPACLGGWCKARERCSDYHAVERTWLEERLCPPGQDDPTPLAEVDARVGPKDADWWQSVRAPQSRRAGA